MQWKDVTIDGGKFSHYQVSDQGQVRNRHGRILAGNLLKKGAPGYVQFYLYNEDGCKAFYGHQLVAHAYIGPCPEGLEINHKNGVKHCNEASNLEYVTHRENIMHAYAIGLRDNRGEKHPQAVLDESDVVAIRKLVSQGFYQYDIAEMFGMSTSAISAIICGVSWAHLA